MKRTWKLSNQFKGRTYADVEALLAHAQQISDTIRKTQTPKKRPQKKLSPFSVLVKEMAPRFFDRHYDVMGITKQLFAREGRVPTPKEFARRKWRVRYTLGKLVERSDLPRGEQFFSPRKPALQRVTDDDLQKHKRLVLFALYKPHSFSHWIAGWNRVLSRGEAIGIATNALHRVLELHNPSKGKVAHYALMRISGAINRQMYRLANIQRPLRSIAEVDQWTQVPAGLRTEAHEASDDELSELFRREKPHKAIVWALHHVFGHSSNEIGQHLGTSGQAIRYIIARMRKPS